MVHHYDGEICIIDEKIIKKCIGVDSNSLKLYFPLDKSLEEFDCGKYKIPSFEMTEDRVRILTPLEVQNFILENSTSDY